MTLILLLSVAVFVILYALVSHSARKNRRKAERQIREIQRTTKQRLERSLECRNLGDDASRTGRENAT